MEVVCTAFGLRLVLRLVSVVLVSDAGGAESGLSVIVDGD